MPRLDFICRSATCMHTFERQIPVASVDDAQPCPECGGETDWILTTAPALGFASAQRDEAVYREHNVMRDETVKMAGGAVVRRLPVSPADQCKCGNCASHARRSARTAVAEPGKVR